MDAAIIVSLVSAAAAVFSALYAGIAVVTMARQMDQLTGHLLTQMSNEHNWNLLDRHRQLPAALPAWRNLSDRQWAWRVLHFNHLNLLELAHMERRHLGRHGFAGWEQKGRYWFSHLTTDHDDEIREGRETLRQVLRSEEGYTREFVRWLRRRRIIPEDLLPPD